MGSEHHVPGEYLGDAPAGHLDITIRLRYPDQATQHSEFTAALQGKASLDHTDQQRRPFDDIPCMTTLQQDNRNLNLQDPISHDPPNQYGSLASDTSEHECVLDKPVRPCSPSKVIPVPSVADSGPMLANPVTEQIRRSACPSGPGDHLQTKEEIHAPLYKSQDPSPMGWNQRISHVGPPAQDAQIDSRGGHQSYRQHQMQSLYTVPQHDRDHTQTQWSLTHRAQQEPGVQGRADCHSGRAHMGPHASHMENDSLAQKQQQPQPGLWHEPGQDYRTAPNSAANGSVLLDIYQRQLLALELQNQWQPAAPQAGMSKAAVAGPTQGIPVPDSAVPGSVVLEDYQMQLRALEAQGKWRMVQARASMSAEEVPEAALTSGLSGTRQVKTDQQTPQITPDVQNQAQPFMLVKQEATGQVMPEQYQSGWQYLQFPQQPQQHYGQHQAQYMTPQSQSQCHNQPSAPQYGSWTPYPQYTPNGLHTLASKTVTKPARSGNHALQEYQMQLMLLEQQHKKRLMARHSKEWKTEERGS